MSAPTTSPTPTRTDPLGTATASPLRWRPGPSLLGLLTGWVALFAWSGMVTRPLNFLVPAGLVGVLMVLTGSALRLLRVPWYVVALLQLWIAGSALNLIFASQQSLLGIIPTADSVRQLAYVIDNGAATLNAYTAPVSANPTHTAALLMACGLVVLLSVDVLAQGIGQSPLVALPLLVTLSVPVSILSDTLALPVFAGTALLFLRLLATEHLDRFGSWAGKPRSAPDSVSTMFWQVAVGAVIVSLVVAPLVPVTNLLDRNRDGLGNGTGTGGYQLTAVNPFIRLRRDLVEQQHIPLVYAETDASATSYLRTTVLDQFTSDEWRPTPRILPAQNRADGPFPAPPGLAVGAPGTEDDWALEFAPGFATTWLPTPYPVRSLEVSGNWRYDSRTLDVAFVGGGSTSQIRYRLTGFTPTISALQLDNALSAPGRIRGPMTSVPDDLPEVIRTRAREVTAGAKTDFAKAVALQDWFRSDGGFTYSLAQRGGSGMDLLAHFVTDDRVGYCEQFAAAMAAMGRVLGIPSRVVVGFLEGDVQRDGRTLYTSDDRHAWPEMYFQGVGWVRFEPTPGQRAGATPSYTRQEAAAIAPSTAPSAGASDGAAPRPDADSSSSATEDGGSSVPWWPVAALVLVLVLGLGPALLRLVQRRRRLRATEPTALAEGAWAELHATAVDLGLPWPEGGSPREQARGVIGRVDADPGDVDALEGLLVQVERGRYARAATSVATLDPGVRARTLETVGSWRTAMAGSVDRERGWRSRVWPASLWRRKD